MNASILTRNLMEHFDEVDKTVRKLRPLPFPEKDGSSRLLEQNSTRVRRVAPSINSSKLVTRLAATPILTERYPLFHLTRLF